MNARAQAEELKRQAIDVLLEERAAIDEELKLLGYGQGTAPQKKRGRPKKQPIEVVPATENPLEIGSKIEPVPHGK